MTPDRNLSHYVTRFVKDKEIIAWDGFCPTHERLVPEDVLKLKVKHPNALFVAHPECRPEVVDLADKVASTSGMYVFCRESKASEFIIGTEMGILWRLKKDNPDKKFHLASKKLICPNMKLTALEDVENSLAAYANSRERQTALQQAAASARNAALLARQRYESGLIDFQSVLDTERTRLSSEDSLASAGMDELSALISLYKALGGGWSDDTATTTAKPEQIESDQP